KMTFPTTASADWITIGLDGHYAFLSSADVVDVKTKKIVAQMKDEYGKPMHSEKYLEMAFSNGKLVRTVSQFGEGIPSAVQARRAALAGGGKCEVTTLCGRSAAAALSGLLALVAATARADDPGLDWQAVQAVCGRCHSAALFQNRPRSWERWNDVFA